MLIGVGSEHGLDVQDPGPQLAVTDLVGGLHRRSTVALGRMVVASGKREPGEDASQVAELDIQAMVLGWRPAVVQQPAHPRHKDPDLIGQLGWLSREVVPQQATFASSLAGAPQWQLPVPESWKELPGAGRKRQV